MLNFYGLHSQKYKTQNSRSVWGGGVNDIHFFCHFLATNDLFRKLKFRRILTKNSAFSRRIVFSTFLTFICLVFEIFHQIQRKGPQWPRGKIIKCEMQSIILALICVGVKYIISKRVTLSLLVFFCWICPSCYIGLGEKSKIKIKTWPLGF